MAISYGGQIDFDYIYVYDNSAGTYSSNLATDTTPDLWPDDLAAGDRIYFGKSYDLANGESGKFRKLNIPVNTARNGTASFSWYNSRDDSGFGALTVTDNTSDFTTSGTVEFTIPDSWERDDVNGQTSMWIMVECDSASSVTEGGDCDSKIQVYNNTIQVTGDYSAVDLMDEIYDEDDSNSWGVVKKEGEDTFYFDCVDLVIGDNSTTTTVSMDNDNIEFCDNFFMTFEDAEVDADEISLKIYITKNTFIELASATAGITWDCTGTFDNCFLDLDLGFWVSWIFGGICTFTDCLFVNVNGYFRIDSTSTFTNCIFDVETLWVSASATFNDPIVLVTTLRIRDANNATFSGMIVKEIDTLYLYYGSATATNTIWEDDTFSTTVTRDTERDYFKDTFDINFLAQDAKSDLQYVKTTATDKDSTEKISEYTDADGESSGNVLARYLYKDSGGTKYFDDYNPFTIQGTKYDSTVTDVMETGTVSASDNTWQSISFTGTYTDPYIFLTPATEATSDYAYTGQVRNLTTSGCDVKISVDDGSSGEITSFTQETLHYVVIDKNWTDTQEWIEIVTGSCATDGGTTTLTYDNEITSGGSLYGFPQSQTYTQTDLGATWWLNSAPGTTSCNVIGCVHNNSGDACLSGQPDETVAVLVIDVDNDDFPSGTGFQHGYAGISDSTWTAASFSPSYTTPRVLVAQNEDSGSQDPQYPWAKSVTTSGMSYRYCELDAPGDCDTHLSEKTIWVAFEDGDYSVTLLSVDSDYHTTDYSINITREFNSEAPLLLDLNPTSGGGEAAGVKKSSAGIIRYAD